MSYLCRKKTIRRLLGPLRREYLCYDGRRLRCDYSYMDAQYMLKSRPFIVLNRNDGNCGVSEAILKNLEQQEKIDRLLRSVNYIPLQSLRRVFIGYYLQNQSVVQIARKTNYSEETVYRLLKEAEQLFLRAL